MDYSASRLGPPVVLLAVSVTLLKWSILASTHDRARAGLLGSVGTLIDRIFWYLIWCRLYLSDFTPRVLGHLLLLTVSYYLIQPELTVQRRSAREDRTSSRTRSRTPRRRSSSISSAPPAQSAVCFGKWSWKRARSALYTFLVVVYFRTSYTRPALEALGQCLEVPSSGVWDDCLGPIFRHECPAYYSSEALDVARECLKPRGWEWDPASVDRCLRPLYAHRCPVEAQCRSRGSFGGAGGGDRCSIKLHGLSGTFPWPPSTNKYDILDIPRNTSREGIRTAYREAVRRWHPDKGGRVMEKESLDCVMRYLNDAYEKLRTERGNTGWGGKWAVWNMTSWGWGAS